MLALIGAVLHGFKLGANRSHRTSHSSAASTSTADGISVASISNTDSSSTIPGSCISKQIPFESTSSYATSNGSSYPASVREQSPALDAPIACMKPLAAHQSSLRSPISSAQLQPVDVDAAPDVKAASAPRVTASDSFSILFSSTSSSSVPDEMPSSFYGDDNSFLTGVVAMERPVNILIPDSCPSAHQCTVFVSCDASSDGESSQSACSASSAADAASIESSSEDLTDDQTFTIASDLVPNDGTSAPPDALVDTKWDRIRSQPWMGLVSSGSSSSSLGDLALTADDVANTNPIVNELKPCSSTPCGDPKAVTEECFPEPEYDHSQQVFSFGMAGHILMTHVFVPYTSHNGPHYSASVHPTSCHPWSPTQLTVIVEEEESEETFHCRDPADTTNLRLSNTKHSPGYPTSVAIIRSEQEFEKPFAIKDSAVTEPFLHRNEHQKTSTARDGIPLGQLQRILLMCKDAQSIPAVAEEEDEPSNGRIDATPSHDSLLAAGNDEFEYAQVRGSFRYTIARR